MVGKGKKPAKKEKDEGINALVDKMKRGSDGLGDDLPDDEEPEEIEGEGEEEKLRDKAKGQKYQKMKDSLPAHVVHLIEEESKKSVSPRDAKTKAINKLFKKDAKGKLQLCLNQPLFEEHKSIFSQKFSKEQETAVPEAIMIQSYFNGNTAAYKQALEDGDVELIDPGNGKTYACFKSFKKGQVEGQKEEHKSTSSKQVDHETAAIMGKVFKSIQWSWKYKDSDVQKIECSKTIPANIQTILDQAHNSQSKLAGEAMKLIKNFKGAKDCEPCSVVVFDFLRV